MRDLANERKAVCDRLIDFNLEPVNAEGWTARPSNSWDVILEEIESSDVLVLILGERYGSLTPGQELSVTHLEYRQALASGLPILAFFKRLEYRDSAPSEEETSRDRFRKEVADWESGSYKSEFDLADDLARSVGRAIVGFLTDGYGKRRVAGRSAATTVALAALAARAEPSQSVEPVIPRALADAVADRKAVLLAGAGLSLSAGMPSAAALAERMAEELRRSDPTYEADSAAGVFARLASDLEVARNREAVVGVIRGMLSPPQGLTPTDAHLAAVRVFDRIVTTNYDTLFEVAAQSEQTGHVTVSTEMVGPLAERAVVKLHGSIDEPESLVLSERDLVTLARGRPGLYGSLVDILSRSVLVVVGHSLRDPSVLRLLADARPQSKGFFVVPHLSPFARSRVLNEWNMTAIEADAAAFFRALSVGA